jgi:hypothetical protein
MIITGNYSLFSPDLSHLPLVLATLHNYWLIFIITSLFTFAFTYIPSGTTACFVLMAKMYGPTNVNENHVRRSS